MKEKATFVTAFHISTSINELSYFIGSMGHPVYVDNISRLSAYKQDQEKMTEVS